MRCCNCGSTFDEKDIVLRREDYGEYFECCPVCGVSDLVETEACLICGKEFEDGDLLEGYCLECLWNAIDYDVALEYMKYAGTLAEFMVECVFNAKMKYSSLEFDSFLEETFKRIVADEKLMLSCSKVEEAKFLNECRAFCLPGYYNNRFGVDGFEFADWYSDVKKQEKQT